MTNNRVRYPLLKDIKNMTTELLEKWCDANRMRAVKWNYTWTINNYSFSEKLKIGTKLESAPFSASNVDDNIKWYLHLYPNGADKSVSDLLTLWLFCTSGRETTESVECTFSIINAKGSKRIMHKYLVDRWKFGERYIGFPIIFKRSDLLHDAKELLPNDKLTIFCEMITFSKVTRVANRSEKSEFKVTLAELDNDRNFMFENKKLSDVTIIVNGKDEIQAHKSILAEHSPVFAAMFRHDMDEKKHDRVNITDMDYEILEEMLRFMYTGSLKNLNKIADSLIVAADKYAIEKLKFMCEKELGDILAIDNALDTLIFADFWSADYLKAQTALFIRKNLKEVINTKAYESLVKSHPHLIDFILRGTAMKDDTEKSLLFTIVQGGSELTLTRD